MGEAIVVKRGSGVVTITFEDYKVYGDTFRRTTPTELSAARYNLAGASVGDYALFAGGYTGSASAVVDAYTTNLTRSTPTALSAKRYNLAGASVGDYALFAGGYTGSYSSVVDAYTKFISTTYLPITAGSKYKLNSDIEAMASTNKFIKVDFPLTGYIKYKGGKFE